MRPTEIRRCLNSLFKRAKDRDEFEYACALLRIRGAESAGWDPLRETGALASDLLGLAQAPIHPHTRVRLGLLLYCHLTEVDAIYEVLENMLRAIDDQRCSAWPFRHLRRGPIPPSATRVVSALTEHARRSRARKLAEILEWEFNADIRNAFFHSDYILYRDELRSREAMFMQPDGTRSPSMNFEQLEELFNRGLLFYQMFMETFAGHIRSYEADRQIEGRFGAGGQSVPVTLLADSSRGLYGFRSP
jgi:hypothetical protein